VLGVEPSLGSVDPGHSDHRHTAAYMTWDWSGRPATRSGLEAFLDAIPDGVLRLKGYVALDDGTRVVVQRVGDRSTLRAEAGSGQPGASEHPSALVAVGLVDLVTHETLTRLATAHLT
jgi:G3E family GTPase